MGLLHYSVPVEGRLPELPGVRTAKAAACLAVAGHCGHCVLGITRHQLN